MGDTCLGHLSSTRKASSLVNWDLETSDPDGEDDPTSSARADSINLALPRRVSALPHGSDTTKIRNSQPRDVDLERRTQKPNKLRHFPRMVSSKGASTETQIKKEMNQP
ncbi:hypothetical protein EUGRSUZ_J01425 [Eucalyptus grandis]|uniref:Uncharacterized protein n=2 Tax=Eucalyptus grandis TaxID=71139 RepID=A0ACC3J594_EUCGR|nr:hypothetical protein EUGRSUZ_J01425 [Eucalyptus grandis]